MWPLQAAGGWSSLAVKTAPGSRCSGAPCRRPWTFSHVGFPSQLPFRRGSSPGPIVSVKLAGQTGCDPDTTEEVQRDAVFGRKSLKVCEGEKAVEEAYIWMYSGRSKQGPSSMPSVAPLEGSSVATVAAAAAKRKPPNSKCLGTSRRPFWEVLKQPSAL